MRAIKCLFVLVAALTSLALACGGTSSNGAARNDGDAAVAPTDSGGTGPSGSDATIPPTDGGPTPDASSTLTDGSFAQAEHLALPSVVYEGAPLLLAPKVISVTFPNDTMAPQLNEFGAGVTQTAWWTTMMTQYCEGPSGACIGKGTDGGSVELTTPPAAEYDDNYGVVNDGGVDLQTFITGLLSAGTLPPNDANSIYMFYMPSTVTVNAGGPSCANGGFDGYHAYTNNNVVYAIAMECPGYQLSDVTLTASHETAEAASDPVFTNGGGWVVNYQDPNTWAWLDESDSEIADLCDDYLGLQQDHWTEGSFTYQRIWSVKAATANQNPCLPIPTGEVYFNSAPATAFLELNVGESATIEVDAFSDDPTQSWNILAQDLTTPMAYTTLSFAGGTSQPASAGGGSQITGVNNGTKAQLTITLTADPTNTAQSGETGSANSDSTYGEADVMLWSFQGTGIDSATAGRYWPLAVMTRGAASDAGVTMLDGAVPEIRHGHRRLSTSPTNSKQSFHPMRR